MANGIWILDLILAVQNFVAPPHAAMLKMPEFWRFLDINNYIHSSKFFAHSSTS
jgi:hypothetical protein